MVTGACTAEACEGNALAVAADAAAGAAATVGAVAVKAGAAADNATAEAGRFGHFAANNVCASSAWLSALPLQLHKLWLLG